MKFHITLKSSNAKVGKIPVTTSSQNTCPDSCPMKQAGCYAKSGPLALHWLKVSNGKNNAMNFQEFIQVIKSLPSGQYWRHNQAGDLPGINESIEPQMLNDLVQANEGKNGWTYTHKTSNVSNHELIKDANNRGFTINLSANNLSHADELKKLNIGPVVTVLNSNVTENTFTPAGHKVIICPVITKDNVSCSTCKLCAKSNRSVIVGFPVHGTQKKKVDVITQ